MRALGRTRVQTLLKTGGQAAHSPPLLVNHETIVDVCFANPGTTEMWLVAALDKAPGIRACLGLQEAVCTGAADGYAVRRRLGGRVASVGRRLCV